MPHEQCLRLGEKAKDRLRVLFLAKWAEGDGTPDKEDGTHATYHYELRETLKGIGLNVEACGRYERLFEVPDYDFLFTLFNRGGFLNSEMLAPLLATYRNVPFLGASPILRGLGDDKHLMKLAAKSRGLSTPDWEIFRRGCHEITPPPFSDGRMVVKPNASSASWGIKAVESWDGALEHIQYLHMQGHDAIVEAFVDGYELAVPIVGGRGPWILPIIRFEVDDPLAIRSYEQKRHLAPSDEVVLKVYDEQPIVDRLHKHAHDLLPEIWPCDYARMEFKYDPATDALNFLEINLSCNLWSKKAVPFSAKCAGVEYPELIETILAHSMLRQGLITQGDII